MNQLLGKIKELEKEIEYLIRQQKEVKEEASRQREKNFKDFKEGKCSAWERDHSPEVIALEKKKEALWNEEIMKLDELREISKHKCEKQQPEDFIIFLRKAFSEEGPIMECDLGDAVGDEVLINFCPACGVDLKKEREEIGI